MTRSIACCAALACAAALTAQDERLRVELPAGDDGAFSITATRPGHYPGPPDRTAVESEIPAHVDLEVVAVQRGEDGGQRCRCDVVLERD